MVQREAGAEAVGGACAAPAARQVPAPGPPRASGCRGCPSSTLQLKSLPGSLLSGLNSCCVCHACRALFAALRETLGGRAMSSLTGIFAGERPRSWEGGRLSCALYAHTRIVLYIICHFNPRVVTAWEDEGRAALAGSRLLRAAGSRSAHPYHSLPPYPGQVPCGSVQGRPGSARVPRPDVRPRLVRQVLLRCVSVGGVALSDWPPVGPAQEASAPRWYRAAECHPRHPPVTRDMQGDQRPERAGAPDNIRSHRLFAGVRHPDGLPALRAVPDPAEQVWSRQQRGVHQHGLVSHEQATIQ
jgi:hypothetical protein